MALAANKGEKGLSELAQLSDKHQQLVSVLNLLQIEAMVASWSHGVGRPAFDLPCIVSTVR